MTRRWQSPLPGIHLFRDSCNVYAVEGPDGVLVVDAGSGGWLDALDELPAPPAALACTHYFRDHAAGAVRAAELGIPVWVPEGERALFEQPERHFRRRPNYGRYDNAWDHFAPIEGVPVAGVLQDEARLSLAGLDVEVVPLAGATATQVGLQVTLPDGHVVVLCGEAIHSPGRLARLAPLQYGYGDLDGAVAAIASARELRRRAPGTLLPSLGEPILDDVDAALAALEDNLRPLGRDRPGEPWALVDEPPLRQVGARVWQSTGATSIATFVLAESGRALAIDLGFDMLAAPFATLTPEPHYRRGSLRIVRELCERTGATGVDVVLPTHFHDDHVASIPLLQRVHGSECWAPEWFADVLEHPERFELPCLWPVPTRVDRRVAEGEVVTWEGIDFHFAPLSGHTRYSAAIGFELDGVRYAHMGDQYQFTGVAAQPRPVPEGHRPDFATERVWKNFVYRNGAFLDSYRESAAWLRAWRPDLVLDGHQPPVRADDAYFALLDRFAREYESDHRGAMALGDDETHFGLDSWGGWIEPYRSELEAPGTVTVTATVRNPFPSEQLLDVALVGPRGWIGTAAQVAAGPRAEVACTLTIEAPADCCRQPIAVELSAGGRVFGQVAEALVTVGEGRAR